MSFGPGQERGPNEKERQQERTRARMEDVNSSTRPNQVTMADLKKER